MFYTLLNMIKLEKLNLTMKTELQLS